MTTADEVFAKARTYAEQEHPRERGGRWRLKNILRRRGKTEKPKAQTPDNQEKPKPDPAEDRKTAIMNEYRKELETLHASIPMVNPDGSALTTAVQRQRMSARAKHEAILSRAMYQKLSSIGEPVQGRTAEEKLYGPDTGPPAAPLFSRRQPPPKRSRAST